MWSDLFLNVICRSDERHWWAKTRISRKGDVEQIHYRISGEEQSIVYPKSKMPVARALRELSQVVSHSQGCTGLSVFHFPCSQSGPRQWCGLAGAQHCFHESVENPPWWVKKRRCSNKKTQQKWWRTCWAYLGKSKITSGGTCCAKGIRGLKETEWNSKSATMSMCKWMWKMGQLCVLANQTV